MTAKRAIWIVRAILYPSLALAAVLLLLHRGSDSEAETGPLTLTGRTAQDHYVAATVRAGRVANLRVFVDVRCAHGNARGSWTAYEVDLVHSDDRIHLRLTKPWDLDRVFVQRVRLDARLHGSRLTGTFESVVTAAGNDTALCGSGRVAFDVHE
jgi:hypothetical protein